MRSPWISGKLSGVVLGARIQGPGAGEHHEFPGRLDRPLKHATFTFHHRFSDDPLGGGSCHRQEDKSLAEPLHRFGGSGHGLLAFQPSSEAFRDSPSRLAEYPPEGEICSSGPGRGIRPTATAIASVVWECLPFSLATDAHGRPSFWVAVRDKGPVQNLPSNGQIGDEYHLPEGSSFIWMLPAGAKVSSWVDP
jgi:hypothetical protein